MKLLMLLATVLAYASTAASNAVAEKCFEPPEVGMGRAAFPRFFFDANAGTCRRFTFGGLGGNGNNFRTFASCMASCAPVAAPTPLSPTHQERTIDCSQDPEPGLCMAYFPRFFHNATSARCETFIYGGCGGNENNFETEEDCQHHCRSPNEIRRRVPSPKPSKCLESPFKNGANGLMCMAYMPRWSYEVAKGDCTRFIYGGCGGNANHFMSQEECRELCVL